MVFVAGDDLTAAALNAATEAAGWTTYTPTWSSSGTQPAIGNGTIKGAWCRVGKLIFVRITQQNGSTTTYGTGTYSWSLPTAAAAVTGFGTLPIWTGAANYLDAGTAYDVGILSISSGASTVGVLQRAGSGAAWGQLVPITWTTNDAVFLAFCYEPAT